MNASGPYPEDDQVYAYMYGGDPAEVRESQVYNKFPYAVRATKIDPHTATRDPQAAQRVSHTAAETDNMAI
jgi:hypothetical protein